MNEVWLTKNQRFYSIIKPIFSYKFWNVILISTYHIRISTVGEKKMMLTNIFKIQKLVIILLYKYRFKMREKDKGIVNNHSKQ